MLPPIPCLVSCPKCTKPFKVYDSVSGNTFGATFWSDGWVDAPMMPEDKVVIVCPHCREAVWRDDCHDGHPDYKPPERNPWEDSGRDYDMAMLASLLDETDGRQLVTKAELMRELGCFRQARSLLARVPRKENRFAAGVEELVAKGDSCVREIKAPDDGDITIYV